MPVCSGGSTTKVGVPSAIVVTPQYLEAVTGVPTWLQPFLPYFDSLYIGDVSAFCAADRPTILSVPTGDQFLSFISRSPLEDYLTVKAFISSVIQAYLWNSICTCISGTITGPTAPTDPGVPQINPPSVIVPIAGGACATYSGTVHFLAPNDGVNMDFIGHRAGPWIPLVAGFTTYRQVLTVPDDGTPTAADHQILGAPIEWRDAAGTFISFGGRLAAAPGPGVYTTTGTIPSTAVQWNCYTSSNSVDLVNWNDPTVTVEINCGTNSTLAPQPCCPPDPSLTAMLTQLITAVDLIQRQAAPFATVPGTAHTGLTGNGELDVQGLLCARVDLTTVPGYVGAAAGEVDAIYDAGWINWGSESSWRAREWLQTTPYISTPPLAGIYTKLAYTLNPGVVATITEMRREF